MMGVVAQQVRKSAPLLTQSGSMKNVNEKIIKKK